MQDRRKQLLKMFFRHTKLPLSEADKRVLLSTNTFYYQHHKVYYQYHTIYYQYHTVYYQHHTVYYQCHYHAFHHHTRSHYRIVLCIIPTKIFRSHFYTRVINLICCVATLIIVIDHTRSGNQEMLI